MRRHATVLCWVLAFTPAICLADPDLEPLFRQNSHQIVLEDGMLSGPGLEFLLAEMETAQFLCLAEPHNTREIPILVTSLFRRLQDEHSFRYLAIEQGPLVTARITELAQTSTNDDIRKIMKRRKKALHFKTAQEVDMIADVARASTGSIAGVWGLDRVLDASYVENWLSSDAGREDPEAPFLRERAAWSAESLAMYKSKTARGDGPSPDEHREDGFKRGFEHYYAAASAGASSPPRVIFRFGHTHMGRLDYRAYASLGRYLSEVATGDGLRTFYLNLQAINKPGEYWSLADYPDYQPLASVGDPSKWLLVDLRPAREALRQEKLQGSKELTHLVRNFDAVLLIGGLSRADKL